MTVDRRGRAHEPQGAPGHKGGQYVSTARTANNDLPSLNTGADARRARLLESAKRQEIDLLWRSANIEVAVTFPETEEIFNGIAPDKSQQEKTRVVNNLKHAWEFLFDNTSWPVSWSYASEYDRLIGDGLNPAPGAMRTSSVRISGTEYIPALPSHDAIRMDIGQCLVRDDPIDNGYRVVLPCLPRAMVRQRQQAHRHNDGESSAHP